MKHQLRIQAAKHLDSVLPYTSYDINNSEYLGKFDGSIEECKQLLRSKGYFYQLFAAIKTLGDETDDGSFARIPDSHPSEVTGTQLEQEPPQGCQYHVHLFEKEDCVELYGHYEEHPFPYPKWDTDRPFRHYRPTWDRDANSKDEWTYLRGVIDYKLQEHIN